MAFIALSFAIYLNFAYMLMNPTWLVETEKEVSGYLLGGNYNQMGGRMLCAIVTGIVCVRYSKLWLINLIPLTIISVTSVSLVSSTTSLACIILFIVLACIPSSALKVLASVCISIFVLIFQVFVVFSGKGVENNPVIVYIVQDVFEKDLTFTNRTSMWDASLRAFSDSPLIGWGYVDTDWYVTRMESSAVGPHNFLLQVLINGGVVLLILFAIFCYMSLKDIRKNMSNELSTIVFGIVIMSLMMTMEVYPYFYVIYMFMLVYYYNDYSKQNIKVKEGLS
ncbi:MAG: O-antigen ligase family protein [Prevotellaceae bacterium]|nr:O-antigen ligase family protein [Candidatus Colivivens caballi]